MDGRDGDVMPFSLTGNLMIKNEKRTTHLTSSPLTATIFHASRRPVLHITSQLHHKKCLCVQENRVLIERRSRLTGEINQQQDWPLVRSVNEIHVKRK
jgi:hypothetical protein